MRCTDLTGSQIVTLLNGMRPGSRYLTRLRERITEQGFPEDDELRRLVEAAEAVTATLWTRLRDVHTGANWDGTPKPPCVPTQDSGRNL